MTKTGTDDLFGRRSLAVVVRDVIRRLGGRAKTPEVVAGVRATITLDEYQAWSESAFYQAVKNAARQGVSDHDEATYIINGEVVQESLFDLDDYLHVARVCARQGVSKINTVYRLAQRCEERLGVTFDPDEVINQARSA